MALKAGRVGVASSEVDAYGKIKASGDVYTKQQIDSKMANKVSKSQLTANDEHFYFDYKDGQYGYNTDSERGADTFHPFSSGGSYPEVLVKNYTIHAGGGSAVTGSFWFNGYGISNIDETELTLLKGIYSKVKFTILTTDTNVTTNFESNLTSGQEYDLSEITEINIKGTFLKNENLAANPHDATAKLEFYN